VPTLLLVSDERGAFGTTQPGGKTLAGYRANWTIRRWLQVLETTHRRHWPPQIRRRKAVVKGAIPNASD